MNYQNKCQLKSEQTLPQTVGVANGSVLLRHNRYVYLLLHLS
jgi:hypothetical protein